MVWNNFESGLDWYADMLHIILFAPSELNEYDDDVVEKFTRVFKGLSQYSFETDS